MCVWVGWGGGGGRGIRGEGARSRRLGAAPAGHLIAGGLQFPKSTSAALSALIGKYTRTHQWFYRSHWSGRMWSAVASPPSRLRDVFSATRVECVWAPTDFHWIDRDELDSSEWTDGWIGGFLLLLSLLMSNYIQLLCPCVRRSDNVVHLFSFFSPLFMGQLQKKKRYFLIQYRNNREILDYR